MKMSNKYKNIKSRLSSSVKRTMQVLKTKKNTIKKILLRSACLIVGISVLFAIAVFSLSGAIKKSVKERIISPDQALTFTDLDCILVLGAGLRRDGTPSDMLRDRLDRGIELYETNRYKLLFSGDHGSDDYNEVGAMMTYAESRGVACEDIFLDHSGFSTYESIYRVREVFGADKIIIVTQEYHMYRALYIAKQLGIEAYGVTSDQHTYRGQGFRDTREVLARFKDFFFVLLEKRPTYVGEEIPLTGNGSITHAK